MLTCSYIDYRATNMKPEYQAAVSEEQIRPWAPNDFGSIDAPETIPAGSHYSYEFISIPGKFIDMPASILRC